MSSRKILDEDEYWELKDRTDCSLPEGLSWFSPEYMFEKISIAATTVRFILTLAQRRLIAAVVRCYVENCCKKDM